MSIAYVADIYVDAGEKIHIRSEVKPKCEEELPFSIHSARWELWNPDSVLEQTGECSINGHELDALVQPQKTGTYKFKYIYEVADEIWVDVLKLRVN